MKQAFQIAVPLFENIREIKKEKTILPICFLIVVLVGMAI